MRVLVFTIALLPVFVAGETTLAPEPVFTTTITALDSSASSGSGQSSASLASSGSGPDGVFNTGSSVSGEQSSVPPNSIASGSWGSQLQVWQWALLVVLCCCLCGGVGAAAMGGKRKSKKKKSSKRKTPTAPAPLPTAAAAAEPVVEAQPLLAAVPPLMPLATSSALIPSYSTPTYAAAPAAIYAAPMTAYAAPMSYAAPASYTQAVPATGGFQFTAAPGQAI